MWWFCFQELLAQVFSSLTVSNYVHVTSSAWSQLLSRDTRFQISSFVHERLFSSLRFKSKTVKPQLETGRKVTPSRINLNRVRWSRGCFAIESLTRWHDHIAFIVSDITRSKPCLPSSINLNHGLSQHSRTPGAIGTRSN